MQQPPASPEVQQMVLRSAIQVNLIALACAKIREIRGQKILRGLNTLLSGKILRGLMLSQPTSE